MYRHDTNEGCGCGGGATASMMRPTGRTQGHIDSRGQCVCGDCEPCDGLTCMCRPRFFDGQLITATDFRRLDRYIVAKSRLHNRYLHGVGVVCGLEAVCSPCDDTVTVRTGYALGPCGEDIVVCADAHVDVAALIKAHRASVARPDCPPYSQPTKDSEASRQKWVLGICYDERAARPVTSLKRAGSGCGCGGSCGGKCGGSGSSGGGCGCGGSCSSGTRAPGSCEPTEICEGYRFTLTKVDRGKPVRTTEHERLTGTKVLAGSGATAQGELPQLVMACLNRLRSGITQLPDDPSNDELVDYAREVRADLRELIETGNVHDCTLGQRLFDIVIPDADEEDAAVKARAAVAAMLQIAVDLFRDCVCSALLPHCEDGCADDCVPLAVLTVRSSDLQVLEICNWSARKFAITMPTLNYWLGWIPIFGALRDAIARLCCADTRTPNFRLNENLKVRTETVRTARAASVRNEDAAGPAAAAEADTATTTTAAEFGDPASFVALAAQYRDTWSSLSGLEATVLGALGARTTTGQALASDLELDNPLAALTLGRLGVGAGATLLPPEVARRFTDVEAEPAAHEDRIAGLEEALTKLKKTVDTQARTIRTLKAKGPGK
jgi:hypothetical protein